MEFPKDANGELLREIYEAGVDLSRPHDVEFFLIFKTKKDGEAMIASLKAGGEPYTSSLEKNEIHEDWDLRCTINMVPTYEAIVQRESQLIELAAKHNGLDDGWGMMEG